MRVVGVLDLLGGRVVHAVAGQRHTYQPVQSRLCPGAEPVEVARALVGLGLRELYVADLDAIAGAEPAWEVLQSIGRLGVLLWVDAGVREGKRAVALDWSGVGRIVIGLESWPDLTRLGALLDGLSDRVVFSLDLRDGIPIGHDADAWEIAREVVASGVRRILVLDLARVGVGGGPATLELCARLAEAYPGVEVSAGGGIRDKSDLQKVQSAGVSAVLVASALHDGRLEASDMVAQASGL